MGIIECCYHKPDDGYRIYPITINDLNNIGKYLDPEKDQLHEDNVTVLDVLVKITHIGKYCLSLTKSIISKHAFNISFGYFDHKKKLTDVIPQVLLINLNREDTEVNSSKEFMKYLNSLK